MSAQITLTISDELYTRARQIARHKRQDVQTVLTEVLAQSDALREKTTVNGDTHSISLDTAVAQEKAAYLAMHTHLRQNYPGYHVAIHGGQLVDRDADGLALSRRIYQQYPDQFVLIRQVEEEPNRLIHFRSPRFVPDA